MPCFMTSSVRRHESSTDFGEQYYTFAQEATGDEGNVWWLSEEDGRRAETDWRQ